MSFGSQPLGFQQEVFMRINDFVGANVILYLEGGHVLKAKVADVTSLETTESGGRSIRHEALVLLVNGHTTIVRFDKIVASEIY